MRQPVEQHHNRIEHWGATRTLRGSWAQNEARTLLQHKPFRNPRNSDYCIPVAQSLLLSSKVGAPSAGANYAFRWRLRVGGGGGSQTVLFDALNIQQVSIAAENIDIDFVCEAADVAGAGFVSPVVDVDVGVSFADGNVSSGQATYSQTFSVTNPVALVIAIPFMATSFRVLGADGTASSPLVATTTFGVVGLGGAPVYSFTGDKLDQYSGNYLPLSGLALRLLVTNGAAGTVAGTIQWGLDL